MSAVTFLSVDDVLEIHRQVIEAFGGDPGLRDRGLLESAIAMPRSTFDGKELHPSLALKAAAYHYHLCANHPFVDGNRRVAVVAAELLLLVNGRDLPARDEDIETITMGVAGGRISKEQVATFFQKHVRQSDGQST